MTSLSELCHVCCTSCSHAPVSGNDTILLNHEGTTGHSEKKLLQRLSAMPDDFEGDFDLPWCNNLAADPSLQRVPTFSRVPNGEAGENSLFAISLNNSCTIRACKSFLKCFPDSRLGGPVYMLFSLGSGVNSIAGVCHGSIITLMFDETFGQLMAHSIDRDELITADLGVSFKRPVRTPIVVLCTAQISKEPDGRRTWLTGDIRDGSGTIFAEGKSLYMRRRAKGLL